MNSFITKSIFFLQMVAVLLPFSLLPQSSLQAQGTGYLEVVGSVYKDSKNLEGADILVMKGNEKVDQISTNAGGKFIVNLELNAVYTIVYTKTGSIRSEERRVGKECRA